MGKHIIYYYSGTGNSLKAALTIKKALGTCDVVACGYEMKPPASAESIGFVFPCYYGGVPRWVLDCIGKMSFSRQETPYTYGVITYGAVVGAALGQLSVALKEKGVTLSYAAALKSFANNVALYDMSEKVSEKTAQTKTELQAVIDDILERKTNTIKRPSGLVSLYNRMSSKDLHQKDKRFIVGRTCKSCGLCMQVCHVKNIELREGMPFWKGRCEQCMACIQWCPHRAIDFGNKTCTRGRYTHPEITSQMFIDCMNGRKVEW